MPSEMRTARPSRDADTSTPQAEPHKKEKKVQRNMNGTLDGWIEPAIATKPSFEDHGGVGYGVVEHLQPLGEPPSARVRQRVKGEGARKSMLGRSAAGAGLDAQDTPESTPGPALLEHAHADLEPLPNIVVDDENDDDYAPEKKSKKKKRASEPRAPKRQSASARASAGPVKKPKPETEHEKRERQRKEEDLQQDGKLQAIVAEAVRKAKENGKTELASSVQEIYWQSLTDARLAELLQVILMQTASASQVNEFQDYVKRAKKKLRAEAAAAANQAERKLPAEANGSKSLALRSPVKPQPPTTIKSEHSNTALSSTERPEMPRAKLSIKVKSPSKPGEHRTSTQARKKSASPKKQPADDDDDLSDLSELTELSEGEEMAVDTPETNVASPVAPLGALNGIRVKDQAAERGSLGVQNRNLKRSSAEADFQESEDDRALAAKKQKLSGGIARDYDYQESNVRSSLNGQPRNARGTSRVSAVLPPKITLQPNAAGPTAAASRGNSTDLESPLSSPALSSRSTSQAWKGPPKPSGKRAKTKTSPDKRNQAPFAGMSVVGGAGPSPIGDDDNEEASENNDFCSSCGGSGYLLCCDGCSRSFHFTCLDPPINSEASELNEPWFCFLCVGKRPLEQPEKAARGLFAPLLNNLNKVNPQTFALPQYLRDHFEGTGTGKNGEFLEVVKPKARHRAGIEDRPDDYKLKDSKGGAVLCYTCGKSSLGRRAIIACDHALCGQTWHLDCLDPPLANPPGRDAMGSKVGDWMCPLHVDHELRRFDARRLAPKRTLHLRRPKQARIVDTSLRRGLQNNGIIEIVDDDSDSDEEFFDNEDNSKDEPVVYQMPSKGIVHDFIHQTKQKRIRESEDFQVRAAKRLKLSATPNPPSQLQQANFARRSIRDQQTALSLAQFANANQDLELGPDRVENLVGALIAEAPAAVVDTIAATEDAAALNGGNVPPPSPPNSDQVEQVSPEMRKELEQLQELIKRKLEGTAGMKT